MNTEAPVVQTDTPELSARSRRWLLALSLIAALALVACGLLWSKLGAIQEQLARQSADTGVTAAQARAAATQAQELAIQTAAKLAVTDARLNEVALQRGQLEELIQSLSRSRDENLVVDIDSAIRLAQQQTQLTGSVEPLLAALTSANERITRAAQPRLNPVQRAIARDLDRIKATTVADTPSLLLKLDELVRLADDLPLANAIPTAPPHLPLQRTPSESVVGWWNRVLNVLHEEVRSLVRISRISNPDAALLSPSQSFFVRENLKFKLLNARLGLLSRQIEAARADLVAVHDALQRYFDGNARRTQAATLLLAQVQEQMKSLTLPGAEETLATLSTAAAGR